MIVTSDLGGPGTSPPRPHGGRLVASVDVEWTKNYRVRNGNRVFCYSIVWLQVPDGPAPADLAQATFAYTSVYVDHDDERGELVELADSDLAAALASADVVAGHQLCSDLAVLAANAGTAIPPAIDKARDAWHGRRQHTRRQVIDTRFDVDAILTGRSRRLVDVCGELDLGVTQPELAGTSMTALHRQWLANRSCEARERITVLNLRHSLSTALVAARVAGSGVWHGRLNVNRVLADHLDGGFDWLAGPTFRGLL